MSWITGKCEECSVVFCEYQGYIKNLVSRGDMLNRSDVPKEVEEYEKNWIKPYGFLDPCPVCKKITPFIVIENMSDL